MDKTTIQTFARPVRRRISVQIPREYDGYTFEVILVPVKSEPKEKYDLSCFFGKAKPSGDPVALHEQVVAIRKNRPGIKLPDAIVMASAKATNSMLLTRDRQLLNAGLCKAQAF